MQTHWHVHRNEDEEDPFVSTDAYAALDVLADELRDLRDMEHEGISALGDAEQYEAAYRAFVRYETLDNLKSNVDNVLTQHNTGLRVRAPMFRSVDRSTDYDDNAESSPLMQTARWVIMQVNQSVACGDLDMYSCEATDVIADEDGELHESYNPSGG